MAGNDARRSVRGTSPQVERRAQELRWNMTPAEESLWNALRRKQLDGLKFRAQHPVEHYILDFYCHECKLVVELDGSVHETTVEYDEARTAFLNARGLTVVRFPNTDVEQDLHGVLDQIRIAARTKA